MNGFAPSPDNESGMPETNDVMMQFFHWYIPDDGGLWGQVACRAGELAAAANCNQDSFYVVTFIVDVS